MVDFSKSDLAKALARLCHESRGSDSSQKQSSAQKEEQQRQEAFEQAERVHLSRKIIQPSDVKEIKRFGVSTEQEDWLIRNFIGSSSYDPSQCTMAMEGKPLTLLIQMDNGLVYMATMAKTLNVRWPGGVVNETWRKIEKASGGLLEFREGEKFSKPTILADTTHYDLYLYPFHSDKDIRKNDWLEITWGTDVDIEHYIRPKDVSKHRVGYGYTVNTSFDPLIDFEFFTIWDFPPHMKKLFSQIQKFYDASSAQKNLGKTIFTRFNPNLPPQGHGHTIPVNFWEKRQYFDIPAVRFVNPNRKNPLTVIHRPVRKITKQNIHD